MAALTPEDLAVHADFLRRLAMRLLQSPDLAEDAVQETMVLACNKRPDVESHRGWLAGALRNVARNLRRGERRRTEHEKAAHERASRSPAAILAREETRTRLLHAILALPEAERDVVLLRYDEGLPPRKVAAALDVPVHTVHNRLRSGLARLRADLDRAYGGDDQSWRSALVAFVPALPASTTGLTLGGLLVGKKLIVVAVVLLLGLATWFVYDAVGDATSDDASHATAGGVDLEGDPTGAEGPGLVASGHAAEGDAVSTEVDATARVHGRVVDPETGAPVAGARVMAFDHERLTSSSTTTDADGRFEIPDSRGRHGAFHVIVEHEGHARNVLRGVVPSAEEMTIVRVRGGFIEGRLVDAAGLPVRRYAAHAIARMFQPGEAYDLSAVMAGTVLPDEYTHDATTQVDDPDGAFRLGPLPAGVHVLLFQVDGHPPLFEAQGAWYFERDKGIAVKADASTEVGDVRLPNLGRLALEVVDAQTEAVLEGITVVSQVLVNGHRYASPVDVDERGQGGAYIIPVALRANGTIADTDLRVSKPGYSVHGLSIAGQQNGAQITMRMDKSAALRATVRTPDGEPASSNTVIVRRDTDRIVLAVGALDEAGRFSVDGLPAGERLELVVLDSTTLRIVQVLPLALAPGETRELMLGGPDQTAVEGVLTYHGKPVASALVSLDTPSDRRIQVDTGEDGRFRLDGLEAGQHAIAIASEDPQVFLSRRFEATDGKVSRFEIRLDHAIRGTTDWTNPNADDLGLGNPSLLARRVDGDGFETSTRVRNDGSFELLVPAATTYELSSEFSDHIVVGHPRVNPAEDKEPISIRLVPDPQDGVARFRIVDAETGELVTDASYRYRSREVSGAGIPVEGVATADGLAIGTHEFVFRGPDHVDQTLTVEITPEAKSFEQTIRLVRSGGVQIIGFAQTSRARDAGLRDGDVIVGYGGKPVRSVRGLVDAIGDTVPTDAVAIVVLRAGARIELDVPGGRMGVMAVNVAVAE